MPRLRLLWFATLLCAVAAGCSSREEITPDVGVNEDQSAPPTIDGPTVDRQPDTPDAPGAGSQWGTIEGSCGILDDQEWSSEEAFLFLNAIDFGDQTFDPSLLSAGGRRIWEAGNLGGSSIHSEILAFEMLHRCETAELLKTEEEIDYQDEGKKTDLLLRIDGHKVGVSVTRAYHYPPEEPLSAEEALSKLQEKLADVLLSAENANPQDAWTRSILQVIAYDTQHAEAFRTAHGQIEAAVADNSILMFTVTNGSDQIIYSN